MYEVKVDALNLETLMGLLPLDRAERFRARALTAAEQLAGKVVWNVNATARGGGVAEMLQVVLAYGRGRWR